MQKKPNYGFPLSYILPGFLFYLTILLILFALIALNVSVYITIIISCLVFILIIVQLFHFKKQFLKKRFKVLDKIINSSELKGGENVLDLGTGSGFIAIGFAKQLSSGKVYGLDKYSIKNDHFTTRIKNMIKINFIGNTLTNANINSKIEKVENKCKFVQTDVVKPLDFSDNFFDVVISSQFVYCISRKKRKKVFEEINRVLKKGGKIIFFESRSFINWDIYEAKNFFIKKGYNLQLLKSDEFKTCCLLIGKK